MLLVLFRFPVYSETFVLAHALGMQRLGWDVAVCADEVDRDLLASMAPDLRVVDIGRRAEQLRRGWLRHRLDLVRAFGVRGANALLPRLFGGRRTRKGHRVRALAFDELVRDFRPDVIHAHFGEPGVIAAPSARARGIPLLVNFRGYDFLRIPRRHGWSFYDPLPEHAVLVAHSRFCQEVLERNLGHSVRLVRRGVNRDRFKPRDRGDRWPSTLRLLTVGRLIFQKGHHVTLEAAALFRRLHPEVDLEIVLAGDGDREPALLARAELLSLTSQVRLTGRLDHDGVAEELRRADLVLIPSLPRQDGWVENFCTVASEALASGCAVIGVSNGGVPETIGSGGEVVDAGSPLELARAMDRVLRESTPRRMARRAREQATGFRDEDMFADYDQLAREVAGLA